MDSPSPLTLEGLAELQRSHVEATAARFQEVDRHIHSLDSQVESLRSLMREQNLRMALLDEQYAEGREEIRRILDRLQRRDREPERG